MTLKRSPKAISLESLKDKLESFRTGRPCGLDADVRFMVSLFVETRVQKASKDVLLARWGTYADVDLLADPVGAPPYFEFDITRRVAFDRREGVWELGLAYRLGRSPHLDQLGEGALLCDRPTGSINFLRETLSLAALAEIRANGLGVAGQVFFRSVG